MALFLWDDEKQTGPGYALLRALKEGPEWVVRLAELILLCAAFRLAASKSDSTALNILSWALYFLLLLHALNPIISVVIGPDFRFRKDQYLARRVFALVGGFATVSLVSFLQEVVNDALAVLVATGIG